MLVGGWECVWRNSQEHYPKSRKDGEGGGEGVGAPGESNHWIPTWLLLIPFIPISHQLAVFGALHTVCRMQGFSVQGAHSVQGARI
jgi:hypothetical protein